MAKRAKNSQTKKTGKSKSVEYEDVVNHSLVKYDDEPYFRILDLFFERDKQVPIKHLIDSYNQFIEEIIPSILQSEDIVISEKTTETEVIRYRLTFDDLGIIPPTIEHEDTLMFPLDAIQKNLSYSSKYTATVTQWQDIIDISSDTKVTKKIGESERNVPIAKIPIMVGSKYCNLVQSPNLVGKHCKYDAGGYFIVNGNEKAVISIESMIHRKPLVFTQKDQSSLIYYIKVQSKPVTQFAGNMQIFSIKITKDGSMVVVVPRFKEISVFTLIRALGIETDEDIVNTIADTRRENAIVNRLNVMLNAQNVPTITQEEAIEILANNMKSIRAVSDSATPEEIRAQKRKYLMKVLTQEILPHVTSGTNNPEIDMIYKAHYICYMIHKLLKCYLNPSKEVEEYRGCDDRDSYLNKRIELVGGLLGGLFDQFFKKLLNDCNKTFRSKNSNDREPPNIIPHIKPNAIEQGIRQALSTGNFGARTGKGISQMMSRQNNLHSQAYLRRVVSLSIDASTNKMTSPRHLHVSQYGSMCPLETPDGAKIGLIKNFSLLETVTINVNSQIPIITRFLEGKLTSLNEIKTRHLHRFIKVFLNNNWIGSVRDVSKIHSSLRNMRFNGELDKMVSLVWNFSSREYHIYTEGGRVIRPYLTVTNNKLNFEPEMVDQVKTWDELLAKFPNIIEYIDKEEEHHIMLAVYPHDIDNARKIMEKKMPIDKMEIAKLDRTNRYDDIVFPRYTHCEIHPCAILGLISSNIPYANHNPSQRGVFQYNQARQSMGLYSSDWRERTDNSYILYHPQLPIIAPRASKYTGSHIFPSGENTIVAIMSYTGYNQEDSLIMNGSSIEKGLFRAQALKKQFKAIEKNLASAQMDKFMKPDKNKVDGMKDVVYSKLNEEGYADVETVVVDGDIIIGVASPKPITRENELPYKDNSIGYKGILPGAVDKVIKGINNDGYPIIKMRIRSERIPLVGDKFSCYDDQTEILTDNGWINFENLTKEHNVATLTNGYGVVFEKPTQIFEYDYEGEMYEVKNSDIDLLVTPNHKMYTREVNVFNYSLEVVESIENMDRIYCTAINNSHIGGRVFTFKKYNNQERKIAIMDLANIVSSYIVSGKEYEDGVVFSGNEHALQILKTACYFGDISTENIIIDDQKHIIVKDQHIVRYLLDRTRAEHNKFLMSLSCKNINQTINTLITGYGTNFIVVDKNMKGKIIQCKFTVNDSSIVTLIQMLSLVSGSTAIVTEKESGYEILYSLDSEETCAVVNKGDYYKGKVYCCTVSSGVVCVRRNGKVVFCGNSRHSQKGTCGLKLHRADMPFTEAGLIPDLILNPNAIPKRMTIGQPIECLFSKVCAIKGVFGDATPFMGIDLEEMNRQLIEAGWSEWATEVMYNGMNGKQMKVKIFIGPTYYQRLKQMVGDKCRSRAHGPIQMLTRSPTEGQSKEGGLRVGEMERDALCAHGIMAFQKERMKEYSDSYNAHICDLCGLMAHKVPKENYYICRTCNNTTKITQIVIPYAMKLFMQELRSINILGLFRTEKSITVPGK